MKLISIIKLLIIAENHKYGVDIYIKMKSYCLKCRKGTENINPRVLKTSNNRTMLLSK